MSFLFFLFYFLLFLFGLCVGSFLNAVIWRLETGESVIFGGTKSLQKGLSPYLRMARSYCPHCQEKLAWHDLIPVLSFFLLRGECRYCHKKISWQYLIVEIATGIMFILIYSFTLESVSSRNFFAFSQGFGRQTISNFQSVISLIYYLYIASVLIVIFVYDLRHYLIPDKILFPAIGVVLFYRVSDFFLAFDFAALRSGNKILFPELVERFSLASPYFIAAVIASGFFLALVLVSRGKWMGLGDVKLAFLMGLILGWPDILAALFFSFALGAIIGIALIFSSRTKKNYSLKSQIPFGPFLILGTFITLFWGSSIIKWYEHLFL